MAFPIISLEQYLATVSCIGVQGRWRWGISDWVNSQVTTGSRQTGGYIPCRSCWVQAIGSVACRVEPEQDWAGTGVWGKDP